MSTPKPIENVEDVGGPNFEIINRVKNIPMVSTTVEKAGSTYSFLKESHHLINWAFNYAETGINYAAAAMAPLAKQFENEINAMDQKLCVGLDIVEQKVPIVKQPPQEIYDAAKAVMNSSLNPTIKTIMSAKESANEQTAMLQEMSISLANELLNTQLGSMAVHGVDNTAVLLNLFLDYYFPAVTEEESTSTPISTDEKNALNSIKAAIGQLPTKIFNRIYHSIAAQLRTMSKEDVMKYVSQVMFILQIYYFISERYRTNKEKTETLRQ